MCDFFFLLRLFKESMLHEIFTNLNLVKTSQRVPNLKIWSVKITVGSLNDSFRHERQIINRERLPVCSHINTVYLEAATNTFHQTSWSTCPGCFLAGHKSLSCSIVKLLRSKLLWLSEDLTEHVRKESNPVWINPDSIFCLFNYFGFCFL